MSKKTLLTLEKKEKIDALTKNGLTPTNIPKRLNRIADVVKKNLRNPGGYAKCLCTTENVKQSSKDRHTILCEILKHGSLASQLRSTLHLPISKLCATDSLGQSLP